MAGISRSNSPLARPGRKFQSYIARLRSKTFRQLSRLVLTRVWPVSIVTAYFYRLKFSTLWHDFTNRKSRSALARQSLSLSEVQTRQLHELRTTGICIDTAHELYSKTQILRLKREAQSRYKHPKIEQQLTQRKSIDGAKWYVIRAFGRTPPPLNSAITDIILHPGLLGVVNSYLGCWAKLRFVDLWMNLEADDSEPAIDSECWHRDNEDLRIVTLFVYLNDVGTEQGAFNYIKRSHRDGIHGDVFPANPPFGSYPSSEDIFAQIPTSTITTCVGGEGTTIICDTSGLHRGGRVTSGSRLLLTARYFTEAGIDRIAYECDQDNKSQLSESGSFALR